MIGHFAITIAGIARVTVPPKVIDRARFKADGRVFFLSVVCYSFFHVSCAMRNLSDLGQFSRMISLLAKQRHRSHDLYDIAFTHEITYARSATFNVRFVTKDAGKLRLRNRVGQNTMIRDRPASCSLFLRMTWPK